MDIRKLVRKVSQQLIERPIIIQKPTSVNDDVNSVNQIFSQIPVQIEVKTRFKEAFRDHLLSKVMYSKPGDIICYTYEGNYDNKNLINGPNKNMSELLSKLPALKNGKVYDFKTAILIQIKITEKRLIYIDNLGTNKSIRI